MKILVSTALLLGGSAASAQANEKGFIAKQESLLLGKTVLYVTKHKAKVVLEDMKVTFVCDQNGKVIEYADQTKRRHDSTVKDFFPPGQKAVMFVTGFSFLKVPFDTAHPRVMAVDNTKATMFMIPHSFTEKEAQEAEKNKDRRYRIQKGYYVFADKMEVDRHIAHFLQRFYGLPRNPQVVPIELKFTDWQGEERAWLTNRECKYTLVPDRLFSLPNYTRVASAHRVTHDEGYDKSTSEYFESIGKFIHP